MSDRILTKIIEYGGAALLGAFLGHVIMSGF